ncbi:MFS transporter [Salinifilum aidingensis]
MTSTTRDAGTAPAVPTATRRKAVLAASIGNFIEWFEYTLFGFFAAAIATNFFPAGSASLISTFAVFGVAFVLRPLGALTFGHLGDRMGRRGILAAVIVGMSAATFVIGALPTYDSVGVLAPALLLSARVVQGFSAGGEFGGATAFMVEYAPEGRRALYGSWQFFTQFLGALLASAVGTALSIGMSEQALTAWGWRIPFLLTLPLGLLGLYLRLRLDETPQFKEADHERDAERAPLLAALQEHWRSVLAIVCMIISGTTATYMIEAFFPAYLVNNVGIPQRHMFTAMLLGVSLLVVLIPLWGLLSDRIGRRRPLLIASPLGLAVFAVPIYALLLQATFATTVIAYVALALALSPAMGALATVMSELFPTEVRYSGLSMAYSTAVSVFGGFTPLVLTSLIGVTGSQLSPGIYLAGTAVISLVAAVLVRETGPGR